MYTLSDTCTSIPVKKAVVYTEHVGTVVGCMDSNVRTLTGCMLGLFLEGRFWYFTIGLCRCAHPAGPRPNSSFSEFPVPRWELLILEACIFSDKSIPLRGAGEKHSTTPL